MQRGERNMKKHAIMMSDDEYLRYLDNLPEEEEKLSDEGRERIEQGEC